jgi:hypothetical protein
LLDDIARHHDVISLAHKTALEKEDDSLSVWKFRHLTLESLSGTSSAIYSRMVASRDLKGRTRNSTVVAQLSDAYLQIGSHYHAAGITDAKRQEKWLPGIQGVHDFVIIIHTR